MLIRCLFVVLALSTVWCLACFDEPVFSDPIVGLDTLPEPVWITVPDFSFDDVRVRFVGPIEHTMALTSGDGNWTGSAPSLPSGTYDVIVMAMVSSEVDHIGLVRDVSVDDGQLPAITMTLATFRPTVQSLIAAPPSTVDVAFSTVTHASGYTIEHDTTASFASASSLFTTDTNLVFSVSEFGKRYVRVRASMEYVPFGRASEIDSVEVHDVGVAGESPY